MKIHLESSMLGARQQSLNKQIISPGLGCDGDRNDSNLCLPWNDLSDARMSPSGPGPILPPTKESNQTNNVSKGTVESDCRIANGVFVSEHNILCVLVFLCCLARINPNDCPAWAGWMESLLPGSCPMYFTKSFNVIMF